MATAYHPQHANVVEELLNNNEVKDGWRRLIFENNDVEVSLEKIVETLNLFCSPVACAPTAHRILRAFSYAEPEDIKVIVIGTSPMPSDDMANGLSFSSSRMENAFDEGKGQSICQLHKALRMAEILRPGVYYCGHEEWAKKGVLLLNAALTISNGKPDDMNYHCRTWRPFLVGLLKAWVEKMSPQQKIFVMLLGYAEEGRNENFALTLWNEACSKESKKGFEIREMHHPTFPNTRISREKGVVNNFTFEASNFFKEVNEVYSNLFTIA